MKEVLKVSIARVSFTLEKDACKELEQYLDNLKIYYKAESGRDEILDDIEERVAELIIEKGGKEKVVTLEDIISIIDIMGKPYENEDSFDSGGMYGQGRAKRSLYRDTANGVVGGVCSGLAAYFKMDVVWVRILFILFFVVTAAPMFAIRHFFGFHMGWFAFMILVYCVLWIIIPAAKTVAQKCAMHGETLSVDEIQRKFAEGARNMEREVRDFGRRTGSGFANALGRAVLFIIGGILIVIGLSGIVAGWFIFLGVDIFSGINLFALSDYIQLNISGIWLKITGILVYFLPFIGMLYGGINLCFRFKSPKWKPGLIIFILWVLSLLAFIALSSVAFKPYYRYQETMSTLPVSGNYDTLYIKYPRLEDNSGQGMYIDVKRNKLDLFYVRTLRNKEKEFVIYPSLRIYRQSRQEPLRLECETNSFRDFSIFDNTYDSLHVDNVITVKDSLITVNPRVISKRNKFDGKFQNLRLFVPKNTVVILQEPVDFIFGRDNYRYGSRRNYWLPWFYL